VEVKRLMRLTFVFVVAAVVALGASPSAIAKGPSRAVTADLRGEALDPPEDRDVVDLDPALGQ
jgi:hypothetical protein